MKINKVKTLPIRNFEDLTDEEKMDFMVPNRILWDNFRKFKKDKKNEN
jgi:hypothetical protein